MWSNLRMTRLRWRGRTTVCFFRRHIPAALLLELPDAPVGLGEEDVFDADAEADGLELAEVLSELADPPPAMNDAIGGPGKA